MAGGWNVAEWSRAGDTDPETERMMRLQDVILKAIAKKLSWVVAAQIAGMSVRNMQRMPQR